METPLSILKKYWHFDQFRLQQEAIIHHTLSGKDTLGILPTGGGKSICYQVPAMLMEGNCLVISPLIALMKDQAFGLLKRGIKCLVVHSGMNQEEVRETYEKMSTGKYKFIFVSPERLRSTLFLDFLVDWSIRLLVVDEAHCISQWGYDFRPSYLQIAQIREYLTGIPVLALTASATPVVQQDIMEKLAFRQQKVFFSSFHRPNISFSVFEVENKILKTIDILKKIDGSCLVYCRSRKRTNELSALLKAGGIESDYYHAGLEQEIRNKKQDDWIEQTIRVMVCTNAFGMGIDKADVRCVIHFDIPDTPEAYYQEAGRAGRDGHRAYAVLLVRRIDLLALEEGINLKYPSIEAIRTIYESLAYYFQLALGEGLDTGFDFEVSDFAKKFKLNILEVINSIKLLEQQGYWTMSDSVLAPSRIAVVCSKEDVAQLAKLDHTLDEVMKQVLRLYSGIWFHSTSVSELQIAQHIGASRDYVQMILRKIHTLGLIDYKEADDKPQLFYLHDRLPIKQLFIDRQLIAVLKERYSERVRFMIHFTDQKTECRARAIVSFFEEKLTEDCGICDICLTKKKQTPVHVDFERLKNNILNEISLKGSLNIANLKQQYPDAQQDWLMNTIRFMLDEGQLGVDEGGELTNLK